MKHKPYIPDDANPEHFLNELYELYDTAAFEKLTDGEGTMNTAARIVWQEICADCISQFDNIYINITEEQLQDMTMVATASQFRDKDGQVGII